MKDDESVSGGPKILANLLGVAVNHALVDQCLHVGSHTGARSLQGVDKLRIVRRVRLVGIEHEALCTRFVGGKPQKKLYRLPCVVQCATPCTGGVGAIGVAAECRSPHRCEDFLLVEKISVRGRLAHPKMLGNLAHRNPFNPVFGEQILGHRAKTGTKLLNLVLCKSLTHGCFAEGLGSTGGNPGF
ncbi:hypothetical protein LJR034_005265 [Caballeronia sp. LjRoot34]